MGTKELQTFGKKLKILRTKAGLSQSALVEQLNVIHARSNPGDLAIEPQLISKWETAYTHRGRHWIPSRLYVRYLIEVFADYLTAADALAWAAQAGYTLTGSDIEAVFSPELDWPPVQAPQLPSYHVRRQHLETKILHQIKGNPGHALVLWGPGGTGKTTLAIWISKLLASEFPDGIIWVSVEADDTVIDIQGSIAESLGLTLPEASAAKRAIRLHSRLRKKRCLLVLDDLLAIPDLAGLRLGSETCQLLCTTRDAKVIDVLEALSVKVAGLTNDEGLELLTNWTGRNTEARELVARLGGLPLALKLAGGQLRAGISLEILLATFRKEQVDLSILDLDDPQTRTESLMLCFDLSYSHLSSTARQRFVQLGYFKGSSFEESAIRAVWGINEQETRVTLKQLLRFALLDRIERDYRLHPLLHDYVRQKLPTTSIDGGAIRRRHALWHIRHILYHPGLIANSSEAVPDLDRRWADVIAGVRWVTHNDPKLSSQAALLAYTDRPALLEAIGTPLIEALETYLADSADEVEQVVLHELLGDFHLLRANFTDGLTHFQRANTLWQTMGNAFASSRAILRMAGAHLLCQELGEAAEIARHTQSVLQGSMPIPFAHNRAQAERLFYWFNMIYNALVRWEGLPEEDVISLTRLAEQLNEPILKARSLHIHRLWCTTRGIPRSQEVRQQGRQLAVEAYCLWQSCNRKDRADDEVSLTKYLLINRYSRRTAIRFSRRRSRTTPQVRPSQIQFLQREGVYWWLKATETQRINWLSWMLPRYLGADNRPHHPVKGNQLATLQPDSLAYRSVENILNLGMLGDEVRRLMINNQSPPNHFLRGPEWQVLSGLKVFPLIENRAKELIKHYVKELKDGLSSK